MTRKKIVIVVASITSLGGGVTEVVRLHSQEFVTRGFDVTILTLKDNGGFHERDWVGVKIVFSRLNFLGRFGVSFGLLRCVFNAESDVFHVHGLWMFHCFCVFLRSCFKSTNYFITPHGMLDSWIIRRSRFFKEIISFFYQRRFVRKASGVHALTEVEKRDVISYSGKSTPCFVIPNFVEQHSSRKKNKPCWWSPYFENKKIFLFFGRVHEKKGWRELLDAWNLICSQSEKFRVDCALVFAGWLDGAQDFEESIVRSNLLWGNVFFVGSQFDEEKISTISSASALILPSKSEGLPMVVLEAWSLGVPVLMTSDCNLNQGFHRKCAIEIKCEADNIAQSMLNYFELGSVKREEMCRAATKLVDDSFSSESVLDELIEFYELNR